ncbi:hypothetical protein [Sandaracinus amylolyticus]|uniref:hypothetical protein n=1 Tax=Sandaracinus amylolyticus TaxID=927083 RepID=UPI001F480759|nr:hypothetical protein [Sandaracinus amylolyticus]UJR86969.1 Hypothetical protein I5071_90700 [Sandaracinus amylolyticus]
MTNALPPWSALMIAPRPIAAALDRVARSGLHSRTPNLWQIQLGVLRMQHRVLFRSETIGTCATHPVRATWRARLLQWRPLRFPFLVRERAIAPLDHSGLASSPERVLRHLLGAHHDGWQLVYDLELLAAAHPGWLERVRDAAREVVEGRDPRAPWLRDLCVFEGYHEQLLDAVERAIAGELELDAGTADDPDITFRAYLAWCARQPETPSETLSLWASGRYSIAHGVHA